MVSNDLLSQSAVLLSELNEGSAAITRARNATDEASLFQPIKAMCHGIIGTCLAYLLRFWGSDRLRASAVSYLGLMSPVVATLIGFVWRGY